MSSEENELVAKDRKMSKNTRAFQNTEKWLRHVMDLDYSRILETYGKEGVKRLSEATPVDTGNTAGQWRYEIKRINRNRIALIWHNDNVHDGANIAILLQYGHGTGTGGYVVGTDYINPALRDVFAEINDQISAELRGKR